MEWTVTKVRWFFIFIWNIDGSLAGIIIEPIHDLVVVHPGDYPRMVMIHEFANIIPIKRVLYMERKAELERITHREKFCTGVNDACEGEHCG